MPATPLSLTSCNRMARNALRFVAVPLAAVVLLMLVLCIPHEHNNVIKMQFAAIYFEHKAIKMFKSCSLSWSLLLLMVIVMWMWMRMRMLSWNPDQELTCMTFWALVCECEGCIHIRFKQSKIIKFYYALAACLEWPRWWWWLWCFCICCHFSLLTNGIEGSADYRSWLWCACAEIPTNS